ncbi:MAG: dihydrolipoyllysine-residue acetyltransferase, partial [Armatimonadetes bacterium]|nr:dihydrolipoyllysine-residue acetyltransferase [Armatimonadota bacterium]
MPVEFKLPDLGEGVKAADVVRVLVKKGDVVALEQTVLEVETDKAGLEVPASVAGMVTEVRVAEGDNIPVGAVVFIVEPETGEVKSAPQEAV